MQLILRGMAEAEVFPEEIRLLGNSLAEAAAKLVGGPMESTE
jgi:hypothetical protein